MFLIPEKRSTGSGLVPCRSLCAKQGLCTRSTTMLCDHSCCVFCVPSSDSFPWSNKRAIPSVCFRISSYSDPALHDHTYNSHTASILSQALHPTHKNSPIGYCVRRIFLNKMSKNKVSSLTGWNFVEQKLKEAHLLGSSSSRKPTSSRGSPCNSSFSSQASTLHAGSRGLWRQIRMLECPLCHRTHSSA